MYYIPQITSNDCLFTAFKILLANVKNDERYLYLPEDERRGPYSLLEIIEKGKNYGLELLGFEADDKRELVNFKELPLILNIKRGNQALHSVYVYKVTKHTVYMLDSDSGKNKMPFEEFICLWDGTGLMVKSNAEVENKPEPITINVKRNVFNKIFQVLSAFSFIIGIFFIDDQTNVLIPVFCIIGGVIFDVAAKAVQLKDMRAFDYQTLKLLEKVKSKNFSEFIPRREKLKTSIFSPKNNLLFYLLSCLFVVFVVLLNNPYNIACVFAPIILSILQSLVITPFEKKKNMEIDLLEVKFTREKNSISAGHLLRKIEDDSYKFAYSVLGKNALGISILFASSFITLRLLNGFDLTNIFFLLFTEIFLYQNLLPLFSYESNRIEEKADYMRFINLLE